MKMIKNEPGKKYVSALDEYINKVYVLVLLLVPGACECAGLAYTFSKIVGWLPTVSWLALIIFDITCLIYLAIGIFFIKTGIKDGYVMQNKLKAGKIFLVVIMFIQFNFIVYMIPATDFWGFAFFFVILTSFFLDYKMVAATSAGIGGSIIASWFLYGEVHLPAKDGTFMVNMLDRVVCVALSLATIVLLTYLINRFLVNAKKDEMEKNTEQVKNVLAAVSTLSESLYVAGAALSQISENESASAQELAATSEQLVESSNMLSSKTDESMTNLGELSEWERVVADNVEKVETVSRDLLNKSKENEKLLNDLHAINGEVSESMKITTDIAQKLSDAVQEIGVTLKLISDISSSTNLLALNASIEAARAGEAGRGFAVVATEVGNLANSTQESLEVVEKVIERVQQNVREITVQVEENSTKLGRQNEYFANVFKSMEEITELLNVSVSVIGTMGDAHGKQAEVIKKTVTINQDIAENIRNENEQFNSINAMAESNANDIAEVATQAGAINEMVDKMNRLLKQDE
ncbi:MAG: methyl-accepting chemotaxis protein [Thermoflexaceae bacterium]|nr:methyl-accepting chemotaxis protein [Thermoflexaceae bacterium]